MNYNELMQAYQTASAPSQNTATHHTPLSNQYSISTSAPYVSTTGAYHDQTLTTGLTTSGCWSGNSYPYWYVPLQEDKTAVAFRVAKHLIDKDLIEVGSVKQFISLINTLVGAL